MTGKPLPFLVTAVHSATRRYDPPHLSLTAKPSPSLASRPPKVILYDLTNRSRSCVLYTTNILFCAIPIHLTVLCGKVNLAVLAPP